MPNYGFQTLVPALPSKVCLAVCLAFFTAFAQAQGLPDFADLVEEHSPAVVKITTQGRTESGARSPHHEGQVPELFREFFERRSPREREVQSMGSGFIISDDGYVLTNNHVVEHADEIQVVLIDRREFTAEVVGTDARSDLALLKIDANDLPYLNFAEPDTARVGEWVLAIGSPFGLDYSVSAGIISAIGRSIPSRRNENYVPFIQTDVAINPGNSGGPLFNLQGEVVGINSQIYTRGGGSIGLSFAIPSELAQEVVAQLRDSGRVERGWLGVMIQSVNRDLASSFGLDKAVGALISNMDPEGPAARSGLEVGDVILRYNDREVGESGDLPHMVGRTAPGTEVSLTVMRKGELKTLDVEIGLLPDREARAGRPDSPPEPADADPLGLVVEPLPEGADEAGVLITEVERDGAAARAGLRRGDVLTQLGYERIDSVDQYRTLARELPSGQPVAVRFLRDGRPAFTTLRLE